MSSAAEPAAPAKGSAAADAAAPQAAAATAIPAPEPLDEDDDFDDFKEESQWGVRERLGVDCRDQRGVPPGRRLG